MIRSFERIKVALQKGKAYPTMSLLWVMVVCGFLIESQGVSEWWKETAQTQIFVLPRFWLLNHIECKSSKAELLLPMLSLFCRTTFVETAAYICLGRELDVN